MNKLEYLEDEKLKNRKIIDDIKNSIKKMNIEIENLKKLKNKTENLINQFEIKCFNYNYVDNMEESKNFLIKSIEKVLMKIKKIDKEKDLAKSIKNISYINEILRSAEIQLKNIQKEDLKNIEKSQMNAIKKGIFDKFVLLKSEIDLNIAKDKFDKLQNKTMIIKAFNRMTGRQEILDKRKENIFFVIRGIDETRENIKEYEEPKREYKILEILADIKIYLKENRKNSRYKKQIIKICDLDREINNTFCIDKSLLNKEIIKKQKSRLPVEINKKNSKIIKERKRIIEYLNKNGYVQTEGIQFNSNSKMKSIIDRINIISQNISKDLFIIN